MACCAILMQVCRCIFQVCRCLLQVNSLSLGNFSFGTDCYAFPFFLLFVVDQGEKSLGIVDFLGYLEEGFGGAAVDPFV